MPHIPSNVAETDLSRVMQSHLKLLHRGKVRDTYQLPDHPENLLVVATDRISIFDFVLNALVPFKGAVLTAMTAFWLSRERLEKYHHLDAAGAAIDEYLPLILQGSPVLQARSLVVRKYEMVPIEAIVRGYLTGSGWSAYQKDAVVCGVSLPAGLHDGSKLPEPIFTPTTKAEVGHDEHVDAAAVMAEHGDWLSHCSVGVYSRGAQYALTRGIIIADTKFEYSKTATLCDEVLTPDSSRFWLVQDWEQAVTKGQAPSGYDKEPVRQWGKKVLTPFGVTGIHNLKDTENPEFLAFIAGLEIPTEVLEQATTRYRKCFELLVGFNLETYQRDVMNIKVP